MADYLVSIAVKDCPKKIDAESLKEFGIFYLEQQIIRDFSSEYRLRHLYRVHEKNIDYFKEIIRETPGLEKVFIMVTPEERGHTFKRN